MQNRYSFGSDIWGIGVLYYELLTGKIPWNGATDTILAHQMMTAPILFPPNIPISDKSK